MKGKLNKDLAKQYDRWHSQVYQTGNLETLNSRDISFYNLVLDLLGTKEGYKEKRRKILDVACGKGFFLRDALKRGLDIYGIDVSKVAIKAAKQVAGGQFLVGNAEDLPYQDGSFDYVTCLGSLEHFPHPDIGTKEIARVLKKGGKALIYVPNLMFLAHIYMAWRYGTMPTEGEQAFSEVFYTYQGWKDLLKENGLKVTDCRKYNRIYATRRVGKLTIFLWENLIRFFVPFNLSYAFIFTCKKKPK